MLSGEVERQRARPLGRWQPQTIAWAILWGAFVVFCLLVAGSVFAVRWYYASATYPREATLTIVSGVPTVQERERLDATVGRPEMTLREGDILATNEVSEAFVRLFEYSTLTVFPSSRVTLLEMRASRFDPRRHTIKLAVERGKVKVGVAPPDQAATRFTVLANGATSELEEGSYTVERGERGLQVRVRDFGFATVVAGGIAVALRPGERTEVAPGQAPAVALSGSQELVRNGDFGQSGLAEWRVSNHAEPSGGLTVLGAAEEVAIDGRGAIHFFRSDSRGVPGESFVFQEIRRDVSEFSTLKLSLDFKLVNQSLAGGGYQGSEYPLLVRVNYRSQRGETFAVYGFYYQNDQSYRTDNGTLAPRLAWQSHTVSQDLMSLPERPREILSLEVRASGHDYESYLSRVSLQGG